MIFGRKRFLDAEVEDWHLECWAWLLRNLGGAEDLRAQPLVLPTAAFFPKIEASGHDRAEAVFARVRRLMKLDNWPCTLVPRDDTSAQVGELLILRSANPVAGTFQTDDGEVIITYDPRILDRPFNVIATFAHELAHYVLHSVEEMPPGADAEPQIEELATELAVAYFGFGVIAANAAFDFQQSQDFGRQGWQGGSWGYFSEDGWVFAQAVFMTLRGDDPVPARAYLKPHLQGKLDKALKRLAGEPGFLAGLV